ncbi:MAG: anthranilate synthase component I family protein, partial [Elusimicrobia bacterium]|nr:anthranilate synthase component I family protein [Elusimicrobiota bacterium]
LCYDHQTNEITLISCLRTTGKRSDPKHLYESQIKKLTQFHRSIQEGETFLAERRRARHFLTAELSVERARRGERLREKGFSLLNHDLQEKTFLRSIHKIKNYISRGDIYQANLSQRIALESSKSPLELYDRLRKLNPSPYACYLRSPSYDLLSCSPELLLHKRGALLETRPIAGTHPRGESAQKDRKLEGELILNEKERAEHIMLVDLERNDLGKVCVEGSVKVSESMAIEKYSHVMHIVSHVEGKLKRSATIFTAIESLFPGGTITGCPKIRCMEVLDELEPAARGPFFGSTGWIGYQGDGTFNILIRSALIQKEKKGGKNKIYLQVGSGIVADSVPTKEFEESLHKAQALLQTIR